MKPLKNNVLIKKEEQTKSSNLLWHPYPEVIAQNGTVMEAGPEALEIKPGDKIIYLKFEEKAVMDDSVIIEENNIIAVVE